MLGSVSRPQTNSTPSVAYAARTTSGTGPGSGAGADQIVRSATQPTRCGAKLPVVGDHDFAMVEASVPIPGTLGLVSAQGVATVTAYGDVFLATGASVGVGGGIGVGRGDVILGPNHQAIAPGTASRNQINDVLGGFSGGHTMGIGPGNEEFSNLRGTADVAGVFTPTFSTGFTVGLRLPVNLCRKDATP
ncbi:MAG TPA: hypothetical protein VME66_15215 [Candidatus Acidoferrales bacterium]|nr:hypothetical protein [Candidatus Acidoferrales bacterium]